MHFIFRVFSRVIDFIFNYFVFKANKVEFPAKSIFDFCRGRIFLRNKGELFLSARVYINSKFSANPIGGQCFSSFVVDFGGCLIIKDGVGISNSSIYCKKRITIEENVFIGGDCKIYDTDFHSLNYEKRLSTVDDDIISKPIVIKRGAFIGGGSIILKGVIIGEYSVIGAGSVVSKSIPPYEIWGGNPVRFIKSIPQSIRVI